MNQAWKQWGIAGLVLSCQAVTSLAGDSVRTQFNGWTVTVTPRRVPSAVVVSKEDADEADDQQKVVIASSRSLPKIVPIRRVSMRQPEAVPEAAPVPELAATPRLTALTTPALAEVPTPSPTPEAVVPRPNPAPETAPAATTVAPTVQPQPVVSYQYAPTLPIVVPRARVEPINPQVVVSQTAMYRDIYNSIPFNRAEYDANPSYRHDATMEFLFNQMRPTIIQRGASTVNYLGASGGGGYGFPNGYPYTYPYTPYYPFSYGLRIHRNP